MKTHTILALVPLLFSLTACDKGISPEQVTLAEDLPIVEVENSRSETYPMALKGLDFENLDQVALRGFGEVSGRYYTFEEAQASFLAIACDDVATAELTLAKYLSDLSLLPGVELGSLSVEGMDITLRKVESQGVIAALQSGSHVYVAAANDEPGMEWLMNKVYDASLQGASFNATVEVPMWLDRWDRFGFRHYYRVWQKPEDHPSGEPYNFFPEFDFAEENERNGIILWMGGDQVDTAEGQTNRALWGWAFDEAAKRKLPTGLNISTGGAGRTWFFNRYRDENEVKMPQYTGSYHAIANPYFGGAGRLSWSAQGAKDMELSILQGIVEDSVKSPNVTTVLEPHGELKHGSQDIFMEYGPLADSTYRKFLQERYSSLESLNAVHETQYTSWDEVRVPEVASFLGWGPEALDLNGKWRIQYEERQQEADFDEQGSNKYSRMASQGAPEEWFDPKFDESAWPLVVAPGHDRTMFLKQQPAVYRMDFTVGADFYTRGDPVWLYLWDLNAATGDTVRVVLNGKEVGKDVLGHARPHWGAYDVSKVLQRGNNQISIRLPKGYLAYRVYLSKQPPREYPNLGQAKNAQWVDFSDWGAASRLDMVRRGMEMIRQVAPNQQITLMAPDSFADGIRKMALKYGGNFHNTGYMGAFWADLLPSLMRGARLPFSLEPGGPARDLTTFKKHMGRYATEGLQGIDYFIHLGSIFWNPEIRSHFEQNLPLVKLIGKYHAPEAEVAALYSTRGNALTGYPWGEALNTNLKAGYWAWNVRSVLQGLYESDGLTESSFEDGDADRYRVVIDTNTSIIESKMVNDIHEYVAQGGVFVCFVQTGRHSSTVKDSWPIEALTGFEVTHIDPLSESGQASEARTMRPAPGQEVFSNDWGSVRANGLSLKPVADDAQPLMLWDDGSVAIGMRRIGEGMILQVGCKFTGQKIFDRYSPGANSVNPRFPSEFSALRKLMQQILEWQDVQPVRAELKPSNLNVIWRHYISNNGLYDVWSLWNRSEGVTVQGNLAIAPGMPSDWALNVITGERIAMENMEIPVDLEPLETVAFLTPRKRVTEAPLAWFQLQRDWWRKPADFEAKDLPEPENRFTLDLNEGWAFKALAASEDGSTFSGVDVDDDSWERVALGIRPMPEKNENAHYLLRREFTVPADWGEGEVSLWIMSWVPPTFFDQARVWINGELVYDWANRGVINLTEDGLLKPGDTYTIAIEFKSENYVAGSRGNAWLWLWPKAYATQDLAGQWRPSMDVLNYGDLVTLPGKYDAKSLLNTGVEIPQQYEGDNVIISIEGSGSLTGVLINGHWVRRLHHHIGDRFDLNITPWVKFGETNEIEIVCMRGTSSGTVESVELKYYKPEVYP